MSSVLKKADKLNLSLSLSLIGPGRCDSNFNGRIYLIIQYSCLGTYCEIVC